MSNVQRVPIAYTRGGGFFMPITGGAANSIPIRPPAIVGAVELQALGFSSDSFSLDVPAIAAGATADVPYVYSPATFKVNFSLVAGATGQVFGDILLPTLPTGCGILGYSKSLVFAIGPPQQPGSPTWTLVARQTYQAASIQGSIRFFSPAGCDAQSITVGGWILLVCSPPIVQS
jgi:hypothetical protein